MDDVRLAERRRELGMTQAELAHALGVTQQRVSLWELGGAMHHPRMLDLALRALEREAAPGCDAEAVTDDD